MSDPQSVPVRRGTMCRVVILTRVARTAFAKPLQSTYVRSHANTKNARRLFAVTVSLSRIRALRVGRARSGTAPAACAGHRRRFDLGSVRSFLPVRVELSCWRRDSRNAVMRFGSSTPASPAIPRAAGALADVDDAAPSGDRGD